MFDLFQMIGAGQYQQLALLLRSVHKCQQFVDCVTFPLDGGIPDTVELI